MPGIRGTTVPATSGADGRRDKTLVDAARAPVEQRPRILSVSGQQFVAAFAGEHHLDVLAGQHRHEVQRHARRVRDRLVFVPHEPGECGEEVVIVDDHLVAACADRARDLAGVIQLAERPIGKRDRERVDRPVDLPRHQRRDGAAVDPARQEHPERHVGHQPQANGLLEQVAELFDQALVADLVERRVGTVERQIPVLFDCGPLPSSKTSRWPGSSL